MLKVKSVFEKYPDEYDFITNAVAREKPHRIEVRSLIQRFKPEYVLDAGCASGLTTRLFAMEGVEAVGIDRVAAMVSQAKKKVGTSLPLTFKQASFEKLPKRMYGKFDLVVCLANSISGVGTLPNLRDSLKSFRSVLSTGGTLVLQMLNHESLVDGGIVPIRTTLNKNILYTRYLIRRKALLSLHVIRTDISGSQPKSEPFVHEYEPFTVSQLEKEMRKSGFGKTMKFGDLLFKKRFAKTSRDLVIVASTEQ